MKTRLTALFAGVALAGSLLFVTAGIATAAGPTGGLPAAGPAGKDVCATQAAAVKAGATVDTLRAFGDCEINRRFTTLTALSAKVSGSKVLTSSDAAALQSEITSTTSGLTGLKTAIDAETDVATLKTDIAKIATDYRVYLLVVRQVNLVNGADGVAAAQAKFATVNTTLTARIAAAKAAGKDTAAAQTDLDAMNASVTAAAGLASPLPSALLALTPAQYDAGTAGPVMDNAKTALGQARDDIKSAIASAKACRDALK
jgi:hypothetical protein